MSYLFLWYFWRILILLPISFYLWRFHCHDNFYPSGQYSFYKSLAFFSVFWFNSHGLISCSFPLNFFDDYSLNLSLNFLIRVSLPIFISFLLFFLSASVSFIRIYRTSINLIIDGCSIAPTCNDSPLSILFISRSLCNLNDIILRPSIPFDNPSPMHTSQMYSLWVSQYLMLNCLDILTRHSNLLLSICYLLISLHYLILGLIESLRAYSWYNLIE